MAIHTTRRRLVAWLGVVLLVVVTVGTEKYYCVLCGRDTVRLGLNPMGLLPKGLAVFRWEYPTFLSDVLDGLPVAQHDPHNWQRYACEPLIMCALPLHMHLPWTTGPRARQHKAIVSYSVPFDIKHLAEFDEELALVTARSLLAPEPDWKRRIEELRDLEMDLIYSPLREELLRESRRAHGLPPRPD